MGVLILSDAGPRAKQIALYAAKPENWYVIGKTTATPGTKPQYVLESGDTKAVFTWTQVAEGDVRRHMSVSVPSPHSFPNPVVVWTLAHLFGFTGGDPDPNGVVHTPAKTWMLAIDHDEHCIVLQEKVTTASPPEAG